MTLNWLKTLKVNPLPALLEWPDQALTYFVNRDLLGRRVEPVESLWKFAEAERLVARQLDNGSWKYPGKTYNPDTGQNYFLLQTFRNLRVFVEMNGFTRDHPSVQRAANYMLSCQTAEGDIRGILGNQYMPYYHSVILELLIKAGYADDQRVIAGLDWLLAVRQKDGGWIVPTQAVPTKDRNSEFWSGEPIVPERSKPHSHMATGMALRALAVHPIYRKRDEVIKAGEVLKRRFFKPDKYNDRKAKSYWFKFQFPFWWTNLLTALDTLSWLEFDREDADIIKGLEWFSTNQVEDGLWPTGYGSGKRSEENRRWVGLAICRVLKNFYTPNMTCSERFNGELLVILSSIFFRYSKGECNS